MIRLLHSDDAPQKEPKVYTLGGCQPVDLTKRRTVEYIRPIYSGRPKTESAPRYGLRVLRCDNAASFE
jgi:hypothetical protein